MNVKTDKDSAKPVEGSCVVTDFGTGFILYVGLYIAKIQLDSGPIINLFHERYRVIE